MAKATETQVRAFLDEFTAAAALTGVSVWQTPKNEAFMLDAGLTLQDIEKLSLEVRVRDYASGPEPDNSPARLPGQVWKFDHEYAGYQVYVKLKLSGPAGVPVAECLSFHEQERAMPQPLRPQRLGAKK